MFAGPLAIRVADALERIADSLEAIQRDGVGIIGLEGDLQAALETLVAEVLAHQQKAQE